MYECWSWLVKEDNGTEGVIAVEGIVLGALLQAGKKATALRMEPLAKMHSARSGHPVRLAHMVEVDG